MSIPNQQVAISPGDPLCELCTAAADQSWHDGMYICQSCLAWLEAGAPLDDTGNLPDSSPQTDDTLPLSPFDEMLTIGDMLILPPSVCPHCEAIQTDSILGSYGLRDTHIEHVKCESCGGQWEWTRNQAGVITETDTFFTVCSHCRRVPDLKQVVYGQPYEILMRFLYLTCDCGTDIQILRNMTDGQEEVLTFRNMEGDLTIPEDAQ
jgi:hypothetical protein